MSPAGRISKISFLFLTERIVQHNVKKSISGCVTYFKSGHFNFQTLCCLDQIPERNHTHPGIIGQFSNDIDST